MSLYFMCPSCLTKTKPLGTVMILRTCPPCEARLDEIVREMADWHCGEHHIGEIRSRSYQ